MSAPWLKFYPTNWRADPALRMCSLAARGLWMEMLCVMHEASPRGTLLINGQSVSDRQLAALAGTSVDEVKELVAELEGAGVFSRDDKGVIYSRRMRRDTEKSETGKAFGTLGGNPTLKGSEQATLKGRANPSLVSSNSISVDESPPAEVKKAESTRARKRKVSVPLPEDWKPSEASRERARALGFPETKIDDIAEDLRIWAEGKGECRADWDATFNGFVKRDAKERRSTGPPRQRSQNGFAAYALELAGTHEPTHDDRKQTPGSGLPAGEGHAGPGVLDTVRSDRPGGPYTVADD